MKLAQGRIKPLALRRRLMALPPFSRRLLLGTIDVLFIPLAIWLSFWLRTAEPLSDWLLRTLWLFPATWRSLSASMPSRANTAALPAM